MESKKKKDTNKLIYKTETVTARKKAYGYQRGRGGVHEEFGMNRYTLLHIK